jgi:hypothetical protein
LKDQIFKDPATLNISDKKIKRLLTQNMNLNDEMLENPELML